MPATAAAAVPHAQASGAGQALRQPLETSTAQPEASSAPDAAAADRACEAVAQAPCSDGLAALDACLGPCFTTGRVLKLGIGPAGDLQQLRRAYPSVRAFADPHGLLDLRCAHACHLLGCLCAGKMQALAGVACAKPAPAA